MGTLGLHPSTGWLENSKQAPAFGAVTPLDPNLDNLTGQCTLDHHDAAIGSTRESCPTGDESLGGDGLGGPMEALVEMVGHRRIVGLYRPNERFLHPKADMPSSSSPRPIEILPSVLTADYSRLGEACTALEAGGVDRIHWDVMDGNFVPNLSFGADVIASTRPLVDLPFEAHLMVTEPTWILESMARAGCTRITVHAEACTHLHRTLGRLGELGVAAGVALNPGTPSEAVAEVLDLVDLVLVMTVNPGFGGQSYLGSMESKIARIRSMITESGRSIDLEVDGGIAPSTIGAAAAAGANAFVVGSAMFRDPQGFAHATEELRASAEAASLR